MIEHEVKVILVIILNACVVFGIHASFKKGMIFGRIGEYIRKVGRSATSTRLHEEGWLQKPLIDCPPCMGGLYGLFGALYLSDNVFIWVGYIIAHIGFVYYINNLLYED